MLAAAERAPSRHTVTDLLRELCGRAAVLVGAERASFYFWDETIGRVATPMSQLASGEVQPDFWHRFTATGSRPLEEMVLVSQLMQTRQPIVIDDARTSPLFDPARAATFDLRSLLGVPVLAEDRLIGAFVFDTLDIVRPFTPAQIERAIAVVDLSAFLIEEMLRHQEFEGRLHQAEAHVDIARTLSSTLELTPLLERIARQAARACQIDRCSVYLWDGDRVVPFTSQFMDGRPDPGIRAAFTALAGARVAEVPLFAETARRRGPVVSDHPQTDPLIGPVVGALGSTALLAVPLVRQDEVIGVLVLDNTTTIAAVAPAQVRLATTIASQVTLAVANARLYEAAREHAREVTTLRDIGTQLVSTLDLRAVLEAIADSAIALIGAQRCAVFELDPRDERLHARANRGMRADQVFMPMKLGQGAVGCAALHREPVFSPDIEAQPLPMYDEVSNETGATLRDLVRHRGYRSILAVPLISKDMVFGSIVIYWDQPHVWDDDEVRVLTALAQQAAVALENARLYDDAQRAVADLKAKNAELDSFVYIVSHDLKAPLVTIEGMASFLVDEYGSQLEGEGRRYLERIQANVRQLEQLILDLLALSRIGREARAAESVALDPLVDDLLLELAEPIRARGIAVTRGALGSVWAIRTQITQVMANLLTNAIKYIGDAAPAIEIGAIDRGELIECFVKDNGIGIDPAYHGRIFEVFQRLKEVEAEGTGVGLAIVKKIVEAAGGRLWVESAKGRGATFRFTWPTSRERSGHAGA